jgi:tetratricopeptide (TPR) repeat protein
MKNRYTYLLLTLLPLALLVCTACKNGGGEGVDINFEQTKQQIEASPNDTKKQKELLQKLDQNIEKNPNDDKSLYLRAKVLMNLKRDNEALIDIDKALIIAPDNLGYLMLKVDLCLRNGNMTECYKVLQHAEELYPENQEVLLKMGELTFDSRDFDRSLEYLSKVTAKDADNRTALFMKGYIYKEKGDTASAVQFFRRVCDKYPTYALAFEELGVLYATRNEPMALEYLNTARQLEPSNTNVLYNLAMFYQNNEDMENAETLYRQILDINPNSADAYHNLGYIELFHYRDYDRAIEFFNKALECDAMHSASYFNRGCAYKLSGNQKAADADFQTALGLDPSFRQNIEDLKRI